MSADSRYRILVLIKGLGLGGAERLILDGLPYLDRDHFVYEFAYLLPWKYFLAPQLESAGFPVHCLSKSHPSSGPQSPTSNLQPPSFPTRLGEAGLLLSALYRLWALQSQRRFDLIHADLPLAGVLGRFVGRRAGVPVVYTEHNLQERYHPLTRWANRLTYGWNACVLAVSQEVAASIERSGLHCRTQVVTLLNGLPVEQVRAEAGDSEGLRQELGIPEDHLVVGTVAVFRRQKRLQDWLQVAAQVAACRQDVTFLLVGHGPEEAALRAQVRTMGLSERVRLPGFRPDGRRALGLMDLYLMTSVYEGLPIALLEALALGKPVVATPVGGIPEVVQAGQEGFLAPVGAIDELAQHTIKLLNDPHLRRQMGKKGATKVEERFHTRHRVRCIENLYLELLRQPGHEVTLDVFTRSPAENAQRYTQG